MADPYARESDLPALLAMGPGGGASGNSEEDRGQLLADIQRARNDPKKLAVLQHAYDRFYGQATSPPAVAGSMREGFPEVTGGVGAVATDASPPAPYRSSMDDFLAQINGGGTAAPRARSISAAPSPRPGKPSMDEFLSAINSSAPAPSPETSVFDRIKDVGIGLLQGAIQVPQGALGLIDAVTGGQVGKTLENEGGAIGFRPDQAMSYLQTLKSEALQTGTQKVQDAAKGQPGDDQGMLAQLGRTAWEALQNPSVIADSIWQSIPSIMAGGVVGRAALWGALSATEKAAIVALPKAQQAAAIAAASPRLAGAAGAIGEGVTTAGTQVEQIRTDEHNPSRELTLTQAALGVGSGAVTALIGAVTGTLAKKFGIEQAENLMAGVHADPGKLGKLKGIAAAGALEGGQEFFQSAQEQIAQNIATGQPWDAGVAQQAVLGTFAGVGMGVGSHTLFHGGQTLTDEQRAASNKAMDDIATAPDADAAIEAFNRTHVPITVPAGFDADGAMARMERANANDENMLRDRSNTPSPEVADAYAASTPPSIGDNTTSAAAPALATAATETSPAVPAQPDQAAKPDLAGYYPTAPERIQAGVPETFADRLAVVREKLEDSRTRQMLRDNMGSQALGDALYFAKTADDDTLPGKTSDDMLRHAERLLDTAGVPDLPRQVTSNAKVLSLVERRAATQAKLDEASKTKEVVPPSKTKQALDAAAAAPGAGLKERVVAAKERQKAALLTGNKVVNEEGLVEPLPKGEAIDERAHEAAPSPQNALPEPTQAQKEAGNYQKGHVRIGGLDISVENPEGSTRSGVSPEGKPWSNTLQHHYGYIRGTVGNDKDHVDAFIKPGTTSDYAGPVFVVDQSHVDAQGNRTGRFDEHKALIGFDTIDEAKAAYQANYAKGWNGMHAISTMPMAEFEHWVKDGAKNAPLRPMTLKERVQAAKERTTGTPVTPQPESKQTPEGAAAAPASEKTTSDQPSGAAPVVTTDKVAGVAAGTQVIHREEATPVDLGQTVKHTTGKGKDIFGYVLHDATDKEARAIDPYTFKKDGGHFIREKHADELTSFLEQRGGTNATQQVNEQGGVQPERGHGDEGRQAAEAGGGDRVQREAQGQPQAEAKPDGQGTVEAGPVASNAPDYAHLEGKTIEQPVKVEETGETATLRMDAAQTMRELDEREKAVEALRTCLKKAA